LVLLEVEFVDRDKAVKYVYELNEKSTRLSLVYGPEGCGKSAWLKQLAEILKKLKFDVIYVDVLRKEFTTHDVEEIVSKLSKVIADDTSSFISKWRK
jgi:predicted AAA+ superfamily ATPase